MLAIGGIICYWVFSDPKAEALGQTAVVACGPMTISITEDGELETKVVTKISNDLPWPVVIKDLKPEGVYVHKDQDWIIKFDCHELSDAVDKTLLAKAAAEASLTQAAQKLDLTKKQMANKVSKARQAVIDAKEELNRYTKGDWPIDLKNAQSEVQMAKQDLVLAQAKLDFKVKVNADPELNSPYSGNEIESDRLGVTRLNLAMEKTEAQLRILTDFEHPKKERQLKAAVTDAELDLQGAELESSSSIASDEAGLQERKQNHKQVIEQLTDLQTKVKNLTVTADRDGLVVYKPNGGWRRQNVDIVLEKGAKIPEYTQLMIIPDMSTLRVRTKVYESMIDDVHVGQRAYVRLDSRPQEVMEATITDVSELPDSSNWWSQDVKIFNVYVRLDHPDENLKPGMTCQVEMILKELGDKTLSVPVAAVFSRQDETYTWRVESGVPRKTHITIGSMSQTRVQVLEGIKEGQVVLLTEPKGEGSGDNQGADKAKKRRIRVATSMPASQPTSQPAATSGPTSQPAATMPGAAKSQATSPASQPTTQPASQATSQPASQPASQPTTRAVTTGPSTTGNPQSAILNPQSK